jgi:hypothetical protein
LENPQKIMVFRQNEPLFANDLLDFRRALASYGSAVLLWVQQTRPGDQAGTVVVVDDTLMIGYVTRLSPRKNAPDLDLRSWLAMLRNAHGVRSVGSAVARERAANPPPAPVQTRTRIDTVFGKDGNASGLTGVGWSAPESGFTWSIGIGAS